jgi:hypothetical protein
MLEVIRRRPLQDADLSAVQEFVARAVESNPEPFIARYVSNPLAHNGRYINADLFKETISVYALSNESRNRYNGAVHNSAAVLSSELFRRMLNGEIGQGRDSVIFLTGIPGAGKTTSVLRSGALPENVHVIFEGQLARPEASIKKFEAVIRAGLKPVIVAVHATPENALPNTLKRFNHVGRGASISVMADIQGGLADGLSTLYNRFGDKLALKIVDVRNPNKTQELIGWNNLEVLRSEGNANEITEKLKNKLEQFKNENSISDVAYRQAAGIASRSDRSVDSEGVREQKADGYRPGLSGRNRVEDFLSLAPKDALQHHPELDNAYKVLALVENQAQNDGHPPATVTAIVNQARIDLAESLSKGVAPSVKAQSQTTDRSSDERER